MVRFPLAETPKMRTWICCSCVFAWLSSIISFIFTVHHPQDDGIEILDKIAEKIKDILSDHSSASILICGDFNIYCKECLVHTARNEEGRYCYVFVAYDLTQIVNKPTHAPDTMRHHVDLLDVFLTSCPEKYSSEVVPPLNTSDHSLINIKVDAKLKASRNVLFPRMISQFTKANWDSFGFYMQMLCFQLS